MTGNLAFEGLPAQASLAVWAFAGRPPSHDVCNLMIGTTSSFTRSARVCASTSIS